ncbi:MAG: hypothetical protein RL544_404, partial [Bacteroidota bacterium]
LLFSVNGDRSNSIVVKSTNANAAAKKDEFLFGAKPNSITYQK